MTIFSRRDLQKLIDESADFLSTTQVTRLVDAIERMDDASIGFEWELAVLVGLNRFGSVVHEPELEGSSKLDFLFSPRPGFEVIGDIRAISDKGYEEENPVERFRKELFRRVMKKGLTPSGFGLHFGDKSEGTFRKRRVKAAVPFPRDYRAAFGTDFDAFLDAVKARRDERHRVELKGPTYAVAVTFNPHDRFVTISGPSYTVSYDVERNPLMNALRDKATQLKKVKSEHPRCIVICDGNASMLRKKLGSPGGEEVHVEDVVARFLSRNESIGLIVVITIERELRGGSIAPEPGPPKLRVLPFLNDGQDARLTEVAWAFQELPKVLPPPQTDASNAVTQLKWKNPREGRPFRGGWGMSFKTDGGGSLRIGSRDLLELLAGRIDSAEFLKRYKNFSAFSGDEGTQPNMIASFLEQGCMITSVDVERHEHEDDDYIVLHFGSPDPALAALRVPKK